MTTDAAIAAMAEAMHANDDLCNANYYVPFAECGVREWDIEQAGKVLLTLRSLGYRIAQDPGGSVPLWEAVSGQSSGQERSDG